jgi:hypothetical protein
LSACCRPIVGLLQNYCRPVADLLSACCEPIVGLLQGRIQAVVPLNDLLELGLTGVGRGCQADACY